MRKSTAIKMTEEIGVEQVVEWEKQLRENGSITEYALQKLGYDESFVKSKTLKELLISLKDGASKEEIDLFERIGFNSQKMLYIRAIKGRGISINSIKKVPWENLSEIQAGIISQAFSILKDENLILFISDPKIPEETMRELLFCLEKGMSQKDISTILSNKLTLRQFREVKSNFQEGKSKIEDLIECARKGTVQKVLSLSKKYGISGESIQEYVDLDFSENELKEICLGISDNFSKEEIEMFAKKYYDFNQMRKIRLAIKCGLEKDLVEMICNADFSISRMQKICDLLEEKYPKEKVDFLTRAGMDERKVEFVDFLIRKDLDLETLSIFANPLLDTKRAKQCYKDFEAGIPIEKIKIYAKTRFSPNQYNVIRMAVLEGMDLEKIAIFAVPKFDEKQMYELVLAIKNKFSDDQINFLANSNVSARVMDEIRKGLEDGIELDIIKKYIYGFGARQVREILLSIKHGLSEAQVESVANHKNSHTKMKDLRGAYEKENLLSTLITL